MSNYSTGLKDWGSTGSVQPDNYYYVEGEAPVDEWDNYVTDNIVTDLNHLIDLTNKRIESAKGATGSEPSSPEQGELYYETDNEVLKTWNDTETAWNKLVHQDEADNVSIPNAEVTVDKLKDVTAVKGNSDEVLSLQSWGTNGAVGMWDNFNSQFMMRAYSGGPFNIENANVAIKDGGLDVEAGSVNVPNGDVFVSQIKNVNNIVGNTDGVVSMNMQGTAGAAGIWDGANSQYLLRAYSGGPFRVENIDIEALDGDIIASNGTIIEQGSRVATRDWVNASADVPNADYADNAGTASSADKLDQLSSGGGAKSGVATERFWIAPYDGTGSLNYSRELTFNPTDGEWTIEGLPMNDEGTLASRSWVGSNHSLEDARAVSSVLSGSINFGGNNINDVNRIDGEGGHHRIRMNTNNSWIEITDQSNNRSDMVTGDIYVDETGDWLGDHISDGSAHHSRYSDGEARNAIESGDVQHVQFSNIEDVSDGQIGRDNSVGFLANWGGNGQAVLWDAHNVNGGNQINITGGTGSEGKPTIAVNENNLNSDTIDGYHVQKNGNDTSGVINFKT